MADIHEWRINIKFCLKLGKMFMETKWNDEKSFYAIMNENNSKLLFKYIILFLNGERTQSIKETIDN
jgi:hypothetical protein